jgi:hypothetical protein
LRDTKALTVVVLISMAISFLNGCSSLPQFASEPYKDKIVIDGDNGDWIGVPAYIDKNNTVAVSVCNSNDYVYLCLTSQDPQTQMQIMRFGLTVWFDGTGGDNKTFGVNFPIGRPETGSNHKMDNEQMREPEAERRIMDQSPMEMEIIGPKEEDRYRLAVTNTEGIQAKIGRTRDGLFVYELQVPLKKTFQHPNAIGANDGSSIGVGLETGIAIDKNGHRYGDSGGPSVGFRGNGPPMGGGKDPGAEGDGPPEGGRRMHKGHSPGSDLKSEALKMWWKVRMVSK